MSLLSNANMLKLVFTPQANHEYDVDEKKSSLNTDGYDTKKVSVEDNGGYDNDLSKGKGIDLFSRITKQELDEMDDEEKLTRAISRAKEIKEKHNLPSNLFLKATKAEAKSPYGFAIKDSNIFVHEKCFIGEGSFKVTYTGEIYNLLTEKTMPIVHQKSKTNNANCLAMMKDEVLIQKQFDHPNIVKIIDFNIYNGGQIAIYSERCDKNLQQALLQDDLDFFQKLHVMRGISSALTYICKCGFSHNDIKLDNILLKEKEGRLADFGLSSPINSPFSGFKKIYTPEQKAVSADMRTSNDKTDVYQFGLSLWHVFHPNPPQEHLNFDFQYPLQDMFKDWETKSNADKQIKELIKACLNTDPAKRPSMENVNKFLNEIN